MQTELRSSLIDCIGKTPVIEFRDPLVPSGKRLYAKIEWLNPNFSVKDRTALGLVQAAMADRRLIPGGTLIESTSGNLGKSLAMLGAILGFQVIVVIDPKVSPAVRNWYHAYGAQVDLVTSSDAAGGYQKARIARVRELLEQHPSAYWPNQYENLDNSNYHCDVTGIEVLEDARALEVDLIVGSVSTGGHMSGIARRFKNEGSQIKIVASDVAGSCVFGGKSKPYLINGVGLSWRSANTSLDVFDELMVVTDAEAISTCRLAARDHGLLIGGSAGLVLFAALTALHQGSRTRALAVLPDSGINYLDQLYDDNWLNKNGLSPLNRVELTKRITMCSRDRSGQSAEEAQ